MEWLRDQLHHIKIWLKDHIFWPHNRLKIPTLPVTWRDVDAKILHASFALLVEYVEKEDPFGFIDWSWNEDHRWAEKEIKELYHWWKVVYPTQEAQIEKLFEGVEEPPGMLWDDEERAKYPDYCAALSKMANLEAAFEEEEQTNLMRLIAIRKFLWT